MINPIDNYAITSGQPGVINEEAYTVLQLVGQIGAKTNECVAQVNENTQTTGELDERVTAAQAASDAAQAAADAAQEAADAAQEAAEASNVLAEKAYSGMEEPKQIVFDDFTQSQYIDQYNTLTNTGILAVKSILNECFENIKINLTHPTSDQPNKTYSFRFGMRSNVFNSAALINNGYVDIVINAPNDLTNVHCPFAFKIFMCVTPNYIMARGEGKIFSFESTGLILYGDHTQNGITPEAYDFIHYGAGYENNEVQL